MTDPVSKSMANKMDYQLKWILANKNEYENKYVLAAKEELYKREMSLMNQIKRLFIGFFK